MVAAGEGGDVASGRAKVLGFRFGYAAKGFGVSAATTSSENTLTQAGKFKDSVLGAQADVANLKLSAAWRQFKYDHAKQAMLLLGAVATWGQHEVKASWVKADLSGRVGATAVDSNDAGQGASAMSTTCPSAQPSTRRQPAFPMMAQGVTSSVTAPRAWPGAAPRADTRRVFGIGFEG